MYDCANNSAGRVVPIPTQPMNDDQNILPPPPRSYEPCKHGANREREIITVPLPKMNDWPLTQRAITMMTSLCVLPSSKYTNVGRDVGRCVYDCVCVCTHNHACVLFCWPRWRICPVHPATPASLTPGIAIYLLIGPIDLTKTNQHVGWRLCVAIFQPRCAGGWSWLSTEDMTLSWNGKSGIETMTKTQSSSLDTRPCLVCCWPRGFLPQWLGCQNHLSIFHSRNGCVCFYPQRLGSPRLLWMLFSSHSLHCVCVIVIGWW